MCTSFVVYKNRPIYAMNFDLWESDARIRIDSGGSIPCFFYEVNHTGEFLETAGMNTKGLFGNFQGNLSDKHVNVIPDDSCIKVEQLYRQVMPSTDSLETVKKIIEQKTVIYPPIPPEYNKLHNMFADSQGNALILETADGKNDITVMDKDFLVMTNFPMGQFKDIAYTDIKGAGSERYITAYDALLKSNSFDIENAFELLAKTAQKEEAWETLMSMVFVPDEVSVYFAVKRNYNKVWKVDIEKNLLLSYRGFDSFKSMVINSSGININDLQTLYN